MKRILFQGDSITDALRIRDNDEFAGSGYANLVKAELGFECPGEYEFINRGISGNRSIDVYSRIKTDIINLKPDVMSILMGVNDVWHEYEIQNGVDTDKFFKIYDMLISEVKEALPQIKIIIMEPFVLKGTATLENWDDFSREVKERAKMSEKIAEKYDLPYIKLQEGFDKLSENTEASYWIFDGVHPTAMGHEYIKREWIKTFKKLNV